jgi:hypothetical protein
MRENFMDVLRLGKCSHEFSWPRRDATGEYYQVCMLCAAAFHYDWKTMRRGGRVEAVHEETASVRPQTTLRQPAWTPRARRIKLDTPIRYRGKDLATWYEGSVQNISQSGLMFLGPQSLPVNSLIEMVFEMPKEISGLEQSNVLCQGELVRVKDAIDNAEDAFGLMASILDYTFLRSS